MIFRKQLPPSHSSAGSPKRRVVQLLSYLPKRENLPFTKINSQSLPSIKVSIAIPTYKRPQELGELLDSIAVALGSEGSDALYLEIIVGDNGNSLNAPNLDKLSLLNSDFNNVRALAFTNLENVGYDENLVRCLSLSSGDFVLYISDDELVSPGSLVQVHAAIAKHQDSVHIFENVRDEASWLSADVGFFSQFAEDQQPRRGTELLSKLEGEMFGGLSGLCLPRAVIEEADLSRYANSSWTQLGILLWACWRDYTIKVNRGTYLRYRSGNKDGRWGSVEVHLGIWLCYQDRALDGYKVAKTARSKYLRLLLGSAISPTRAPLDFRRVREIERSFVGHVRKRKVLFVNSALLICSLVPKGLVSILLRQSLPSGFHGLTGITKRNRLISKVER